MKGKKLKSTKLTQKILCTILAASVFGVCGNVSAAEEYLGEKPGTAFTGQDVIIAGEFHGDPQSLTITEPGPYTIGKLEISGETTVNLNVAGNITNGIYMHTGDVLSLTAKDAVINGYVKITGGYAELTGGSIESGGYYQKENGQYTQEDIRVTSGSGLEATNVAITGDVMAEDTNDEGEGSFVTITGGSVNETVYYKVDENAEGRPLVMVGGNPVADGYTELHAETGGVVTVNNAELNTGVSAFGNGSVVTVNESSINTKGGIFAAMGGQITLNGNADTVYSVADDGCFMAISGEADGENGKGSIELIGGTLKAENLRYLVGLENNSFFDGEEIEYTVTKGGIVLKDNGVIETKGDQIFERGVDVSSDEAVLNSTSGKVTNDAISYEGGTLKLTDEKYSWDYLNSAIESLTAYQNNSNTEIYMTGKLVNENGDVQEETSLDEINEEGSENGRVDTVVYTDKNFIVGTNVIPKNEIDGVKVQQAVEKGFYVTSLDLRDGATGMVITDDRTVKLTGSADNGELITADGVKNEAVKVVVGLDENTVLEGVGNNKGTFVIGDKLAASDTKYTLTGSVTVNKDSVIEVHGKTNVTKGITLNSGSVNVGNGTLVSDITANGNSTITGAAQVETLKGAADAVINIGNTDKAGNVTVANADLQGATVFLDPAWVDGAEITDASKMAVAGTDGKVTLNGNYVVGQNSVMSFGVANNDKAQETFAKTGLTWGEDAITAGLYINGSVDLNGKAIVVDGKLTDVKKAVTNAGTFTAAENSVVMVDGQSIKDTAAITGVTEANVDIKESSKLYIDGAKKGENYHVIDGVTTKGWADENIISNNALLVFTGENADNQFNVSGEYDKVANVYGAGAVEIANVVDATLETKDEGDAAFDFFNAAANSNNNLTKDAQVAAFNSAANMGELAGVNHGTYSMSNAMTDAVAHHLSLATHGEQDKDIWAHYIHNKEDIDGMDLGGIDGSYDAQYNGIVVGSDLYKNGKVTAGVALSYADGNIDGSNIAATTKNDAEYCGASLYGRIDNGNSAILGDISYLHSDNDITQNNSGHEITASADADAFSIGIRAEQAYEAGAGKFVPYAGIRYMHLGAGNYDNSLGMSYDADDQNLWLLPVGVTYSAEVQSGDWTVKPVAEVGYVWTMGDRDTDMTVSLNGAADSFGFETADSGSFIGRLGIEAEKANVTYGLGYEYQKGDTVKANKWMANLTFSF